MKVKNAKRTVRFSTAMFYSKEVGLLKDLQNVQKDRGAKYQTFLELLELEVHKRTRKNSSYQIVTIRV